MSRLSRDSVSLATRSSASCMAEGLCLDFLIYVKEAQLGCDRKARDADEAG